jgi:hypothetical protein
VRDVSDREPLSPDEDTGTQALERLVPWIVFALVAVIVVLSLIASFIGAPWAP